ncbi:hypothetical protein [Streptomyces sp. NPDC001635]|nr:hypothetical protein E4K10_46600 [Streptomyces sp. T1317-0309]
MHFLMSGLVIATLTTAAFIILVTVVKRTRRGAQRHTKRRLVGAADAAWSTAQALQRFPMDAVRPWLLGPVAADLSHLYTAWIFATNGQDAVWLERHLGLPEGLAHLLADAARQRH